MTKRLIVLIGLALLGSCASSGPEGMEEGGGAARARSAEETMVLGEDLLRAGQWEEARLEFEQAIAINPNLTAAWIGLGRVDREMGEAARAERSYARAVELSPENFDARYGQAFMLHLLDRLHEAVRGYLEALRLREDDFDANLNLATAYLQLGEASAGLAYAERAVRVAPESGPARVNLGVTYAALGRHEDAVTEYQQAAELMDLTPELLLNLADSLGKTGRFEEMVGVAEQMVMMHPSALGYERLGAGLFSLRKYDEALGAFEQALELDSGHYPAWNGVGVSYLNRYLWSNKKDKGSLDRAVDALRRSIRIERRQPKVLEWLSRYG